MIDLCIVHYKTPDKLFRLIDPLRSEGGDYTLSVYDNSYMDDDTVFVKLRDNFPLQGVRFLYFSLKNVGYAKACNSLANHTKNDIVGFLNADVWLTPSDVMSIQKSFDDNPEIAILGPKQRDEQGRITHAGIEGDNKTAKPRAWHVSDPEDKLFRNLEEMVSVAGSAYFIRRSVLEEMAQCPTFQDACPEAKSAWLVTPHFFEETFLSYHARAHGHKVYYDGRISIGHSWAASTGGPDPILRKYFLESREIFNRACDAHGIER